MIKNDKTLFFALFVLLGFQLSAQVGINTQTPNTNSVLDVVSSSKGILIPRLTDSEVTALAGKTPPNGMLIFNNTKNCIQVYKDTAFVCLVIEGTTDFTNDAWINDNANTQVILGTQSNGTTERPVGTEFVIKNNGYVGIGTTSPSANFQVSSNNTSHSRIASFYSPNSLTDGNNITLSLGTANTVKNEAQFRYIYKANADNANRLDIGFNGVGTAPITVLAGGNVGIGMNSPSAALEVNGNVEIGTVAQVASNNNYAPLVWNTTTKRIESIISENVKKLVTGVASGSTSSFYTLQDNSTGAYEIKVFSNNLCGQAFYDKFFIAGAKSNPDWALNYVGGVSGGGSTTTSNPVVTRLNAYTVKVENPSVGCADGGNSTTFTYTLSVNQSTGVLSIQNNGNISKDYNINIEKVF